MQIRVIAQWLQKLDPQSDGAARDWVAIYDECSRILYQEIDYRLEGANADRFRSADAMAVGGASACLYMLEQRTGCGRQPAKLR